MRHLLFWTKASEAGRSLFFPVSDFKPDDCEVIGLVYIKLIYIGGITAVWKGWQLNDQPF
jgi:hypothetical protein